MAGGKEKFDFYLLETVGDVEPVLHGPFPTQRERDALALELKNKNGDENGLFPVSVPTRSEISIGCYADKFFEETEKRTGAKAPDTSVPDNKEINKHGTEASRKVTEMIRTLAPFIGSNQMNTMISGLRESEEKEFFLEKFVEFSERVSTMPKIYEQEDKGDEAIVFLHYFKNGADFYITEKDSDPDGSGQAQAFGLADLGYGQELGYISIAELIENDVEIDLFFEPQPISELKKSLDAAADAPAPW